MEFNEHRDEARDAMYEVAFPTPEVSGSNDSLTLVVALHGYADAGHAVASSASHLLAALENRPLATFSTDELVDYRSRRPAVTMRNDEIIEMADMELKIDVVRDNSGTSFLLLSGPEPDLRWNAFAEAVAKLADKFQVTRTVSLYAAPMAVPHTRPLDVLVHGNDAEVSQRMRGWQQKVTVPGAASLRIEFELAKQGKRTSGFTAQVPHYIMHSDYPLASLRLLQEVARAGHLDLPLQALEREADHVSEVLSEQTSESHEIAQVVQMLEQQYDEEAAKRKELEASPLLAPDGTVPTADEIGAEFEDFLAQVSRSSQSDTEDSATDAPDAEDNPDNDDRKGWSQWFRF